MTDKQVIARWAKITDPVKALEALAENRAYIGDDPYYRDLDKALWAMVDRVLVLAKAVA